MSVDGSLENRPNGDWLIPFIFARLHFMRSIVEMTVMYGCSTNHNPYNRLLGFTRRHLNFQRDSGYGQLEHIGQIDRQF
jgi:hypothetical protein